MRAIIDKSVPSALTYYSTYLAEPSPAGDMTFKKDDLVAYDHLDLKKLLTEMKAAGSGGRDLRGHPFLADRLPHEAVAGCRLLYCCLPAWTRYWRPPRASAAATPSSRSPGLRVPEAWRQWFKDFDPGIKLDADFATNPDWQSYVERQYDRWFEERGRAVLKLHNGGRDLRELLDLLDSVRKPADSSGSNSAPARSEPEPDQIKKVAGFRCERERVLEIVLVFLEFLGCGAPRPPRRRSAWLALRRLARLAAPLSRGGVAVGAPLARQRLGRRRLRVGALIGRFEIDDVAEQNLARRSARRAR